MFTGLIREIAKVVEFNNNILKLKAEYKPKLGDSIAINGVCLTVVNLDNSTFSVELSKETQNIIAIENYKNQVHIEPAMKLNDRLEGHIVQGHVDVLGKIVKIEKFDKAYNFFIKIKNEFIKYIVPKGSITIDGVSLTINSIENNIFRLTIIPYTIQNTIFKNYKIGTLVNIETDMFARYIYHITNFQNNNKLKWNDINHIMNSY